MGPRNLSYGGRTSKGVGAWYRKGLGGGLGLIGRCAVGKKGGREEGDSGWMNRGTQCRERDQ